MTLIVAMLAVCTGSGIVLVVTGIMRQPAQSEQEMLIAALPSDRSLSLAIQRASDKAQQRLHGKKMVLEDLRMINRSVERHAMVKLMSFAGVAGVLGLAGFFLILLGINIPVLAIVLAAGMGGAAGWAVPDSILRTESDKEREHFQQVAESWLELVSQLVTAGEDTFAALVAAASYSKQPTFLVIRDALRAGAARGEPPWTGLRRLADDRRLRFLDPFCAALELAGTTGAGARQTITSHVDAARSKAMHAAEARAASSGEKMGAPLALIGGAFMILMGYPPLIGIMDQSSIIGTSL